MSVEFPKVWGASSPRGAWWLLPGLRIPANMLNAAFHQRRECEGQRHLPGVPERVEATTPRSDVSWGQDSRSETKSTNCPLMHQAQILPADYSALQFLLSVLRAPAQGSAWLKGTVAELGRSPATTAGLEPATLRSVEGLSSRTPGTSPAHHGASLEKTNHHSYSQLRSIQSRRFADHPNGSILAAEGFERRTKEMYQY